MEAGSKVNEDSAATKDQGDNLRECDLVMKGGITSGVVYPPALIKLSREYRFCSIGGTSAGAIAAAGAAAAEFGREDGGFGRLDGLRVWISDGKKVRNLFTPSASTRPLMDTVFDITPALQTPGWLKIPKTIGRTLLSLVRNDTKAYAAGAIAGMGLPITFANWVGGSMKGRGKAVLLFGIVGGVIGSITHLAMILLKNVPRNSYGLCKGHEESNSKPTSTGKDSEILTDWLSGQIDHLAGLPPGKGPLTFGDLAKKKVGGEDRGIELKMVTTNLSHGQPYVVPFAQHKAFIFNECEMREFFPGYVVDQMVRPRGEKAQPAAEQKLPPGYHYFPAAKDLPVIVATRMSLSAPVLISAIPLYTISSSARGKSTLVEQDLQLNLFSDGGISSNFPIHFFDRWLPTRPTFGINLTSMPQEAITNGQVGQDYQSLVSPAATASMDPVVLPKADQEISPEWKPIRGLFDFIWSAWATAQNYRDNTQSMLPSYRERIVQVRFASNEGGLNLAMDDATIRRILEKGDEAGNELLQFNFDHHRWTRFYVLMDQLETQIEKLGEVLEFDPEKPRKPRATSYSELVKQIQLEANNEGKPFPYCRDEEWCNRAESRAAQLMTLIARWHEDDEVWQGDDEKRKGKHFFGYDSPTPRPALRVTPEV
jgi:predicted acylesterase/phospholipase RssA